MGKRSPASSRSLTTSFSGGILGPARDDVRRCLEHVPDQRLATLGLAPRYGSANPFAFIALQDVQELANFFERRVSSYQVGVGGEVVFDAKF
jgi:ribonucleoside-diphosphate reductase beta chain